MKTPKVLDYSYDEEHSVETLVFSVKALKDALYFGLDSGDSADKTTIRNFLRLQELKYTYSGFGETLRVHIDLKEQGLPPYGYR